MSIKVTAARHQPLNTAPVCLDAKPPSRQRPSYVYKPCVICQKPTKSRTVPPPGSKLSPVHLCSWCAYVVTDINKLPTAEQTALWKHWLDDSLDFRERVRRKQTRSGRYHAY